MKSQQYQQYKYQPYQAERGKTREDYKVNEYWHYSLMILSALGLGDAIQK